MFYWGLESFRGDEPNLEFYAVNRRLGCQSHGLLPHHIFGMGSLFFIGGMVRVAGCLAGEDTQMLLQAAALGSSWYKSSVSRLCLRGIQQQQATRQITPGPGLKHRAPGKPGFASLRGGRGLSPSCSGRVGVPGDCWLRTRTTRAAG